MRIARTALGAAFALSMTATPALAQTAAPLSVVASSGMMQADGAGSNEGSQLIPALVIMGVIAAAILITTNSDSDIDNPASP